MKIKKLILNNVFLSGNIVVLITVLFLFDKLEQIVYFSIVSAVFLALINFLSGIYLIKKGIDRNDKQFFMLIFGGMVLRLFLVLLLIIIGLKFLFLSQYYFIFTLFIFYFYFQVVEIYHINQSGNRISIKN